MTPRCKEAVWETIQTLNRLWTREGRPAELAFHFHSRMVAVVPQERARKVGQAACVEGWSSFCRQAEVHSWTESEPLIELFNDGHCAVVSYYFEIDFTINGQRIRQKGRDLFTLIYEEGRYQVVSDQYSPCP